MENYKWIKSRAYAGLVLGVHSPDELTSGIPKYFAKVYNMISAKYYVGILGRSFYGCKYACGIARMRQAYFARAGFEQRPAG